ncbi:MAG: hypothetical protein [Circular genetic element sp.]|nr:MAG: hypothetical protein [Circular genetic element sp.]
MENTKCDTCTIVENIYGSSDAVVPWLCECQDKSAAQSSLQQTKLYIEKPKQTIRILVPKMSERQRRIAKAALVVVKPHNRQERL